MPIFFRQEFELGAMRIRWGRATGIAVHRAVELWWSPRVLLPHPPTSKRGLFTGVLRFKGVFRAAESGGFLPEFRSAGKLLVVDIPVEDPFDDLSGGYKTRFWV